MAPKTPKSKKQSASKRAKKAESDTHKKEEETVKVTKKRKKATFDQVTFTKVLSTYTLKIFDTCGALKEGVSEMIFVIRSNQSDFMKRLKHWIGVKQQYNRKKDESNLYENNSSSSTDKKDEAESSKSEDKNDAKEEEEESDEESEDTEESESETSSIVKKTVKDGKKKKKLTKTRRKNAQFELKKIYPESGAHYDMTLFNVDVLSVLPQELLESKARAIEKLVALHKKYATANLIIPIFAKKSSK